MCTGGLARQTSEVLLSARPSPGEFPSSPHWEAKVLLSRVHWMVRGRRRSQASGNHDRGDQKGVRTTFAARLVMYGQRCSCGLNSSSKVRCRSGFGGSASLCSSSSPSAASSSSLLPLASLSSTSVT